MCFMFRYTNLWAGLFGLGVVAFSIAGAMVCGEKSFQEFAKLITGPIVETAVASKNVIQ